MNATPCILKGFPRVVATEAGKAPVVAVDGAFFVGQEISATMSPGSYTTLSLETERDCDARYASGKNWPTLIYHTATVTIPGGGNVVVHDNFDVECGLFTGQFGVAQPEPQYTQSPIDGATAAIELPSAVAAGGTLDYVIDLTNPTAHDMVLDPCPSYQQSIGEGGKDPVEFNCPAVHLLPAGQTKRFAMQLAVPADFPSGQAEVYWGVAAFTDPDLSARGSVDVIGADTPCLSDQLTAAITGPGTVPGLPNMYGVKGYASAVPLVLTNRSSAICSVRGAPTVDLRAADGHGLGLMQINERDVIMTNLPSPTVVLAPGDAATTTLYWYSDFCGSDPNPLTVTITLPANGAALKATPVGGWRPPPCPDGPPGHGQVGADPFQPGADPVQPG